MFQDRVITCLSCSQITRAESVSALPENSYYRPQGQQGDRERPGRGRTVSATGEEVYYSDSEDDFPHDDHSQEANHSVENGTRHVQGVRDMVVNTQKANHQKVIALLEENSRAVSAAKVVQSQKEQLLKEAVRANHILLKKLNEELNNNQVQASQLTSNESQLMKLKTQLNKCDIMDYNGINSIYQEGINIKNSIASESEASRHHGLEQSVRNSTVKILFEKCDEFISSLNAENDKIFIKLAPNFENEAGMIYLTTFMLGNIFSEHIAAKNATYKDLLNLAQNEEKEVPPALDDVSPYLEFLQQHFQSLNIKENENKSQENQELNRDSDASSPDEWKVVSSKETKKDVKKPMSFSDMAKKPGNPQPVVKRIPFPEKTIAQTNRPHCYFKVQVDNEVPFRVVFELRPDMAPKMVENFLKLCKGLPDGRGYKGSKIFRAKMNDHILGGDIENDDGTGGHSAYEEKYFLAEQCPLKDHKGAIRMKGLERTMDGRCRIGSQFMIWVGDLDYKEYRFTLVFGKVVEGFEQLREISRIKAVQKSPTSWVLRQNVLIIESGTL